MELQALLILCGVGVAGIAVVLLMGLFSASGTSYEEAIAQQRKAATELLALADNKGKAKKTNKKANKKLAKKEKNKDNAAAATASEPESEAPAESGVEDESAPAPAPAAKPHVEFSPPVVVEVPADNLPNIKIRKRGKDPKVKPILLNKEDPSCVSDPSTLPSQDEITVSNHFEEMQPKDDFELLHSALASEKLAEKKEEVTEKKEVKGAKPPKSGKASGKQTPPEPVKDEGSRERHSNGDAPKDQRKVKKTDKKQATEESKKEEEEVVPPLNAPQPSELTTEKLLKQALAPVTAVASAAAPAPAPAPVPVPAPAPSPPGGKGKKKKAEPNVLSIIGEGGNVAVSELVRVLREAALSRTEIQILTDALLNKHHDPLPEHSEWSEGTPQNDPLQKIKKQLAEKEKALETEIENHRGTNNMLKELRATLASERAKAAAAGRAAEQQMSSLRAELNTLQKRLDRLLEENKNLTQEKAAIQVKLTAEGEAQRVQMEMHIQRLVESEAALMQQLGAQQAQLSARALEAQQAAAARDALLLAQQHAADFMQQLQDANIAYAELEQQRQCAIEAERQAQQGLMVAQEQLAAMAELQNEIQRLTARAQTAETNLDKLKEESEKQNQQLSSELSSLREELAAKETELAEVKQLKAAPTQNGLPTISDEQKAAELAKVESAVEALRGELAGAHAAGADLRAQLARLQRQLDAHRDKNNELRTKNWKVMEALQSAEKALQAKSASALPAQDVTEAIAKATESQYNEVANVLRSACPAASPATAVGRDWLQAFADNLKSELNKREAEKKLLSNDNENRLIAQNEHLQSVIDKYKRIIDDTEGVLSRLQQNVSTEERRWAQQLADKQRELDDLRSRTIMQEPLAFAYSCIEKSLPTIVEEMQNKIDALQAELQQKQLNYSNSFADSERLAQERIADLSAKDVHNGPLQVALEDK